MCETERERGGRGAVTHMEERKTEGEGGGGGGGELSECVRQNETEGGEGERHRE